MTSSTRCIQVQYTVHVATGGQKERGHRSDNSSVALNKKNIKKEGLGPVSHCSVTVPYYKPHTGKTDKTMNSSKCVLYESR